MLKCLILWASTMFGGDVPEPQTLPSASRLPDSYRVRPRSFTHDMHQSDGFVISTRAPVWLPDGNWIFSDFISYRGFSDGRLENVFLGLLAVAADSGEARLLKLPGVDLETRERSSYMIRTPFRFSKESCAASVWRDGAASDAFSYADTPLLWEWDPDEDHVRVINSWHPLLNRLLPVLDSARCSVCWHQWKAGATLREFEVHDRITGRFVNLTIDTERDVDADTWLEDVFDRLYRFVPADGPAAFVMLYPRSDNSSDVRIACMDLESGSGYRWKLSENDLAKMIGGEVIGMRLVPNNLRSCHTIALVVEKEDSDYHLLCLSSKSGQPVSPFAVHDLPYCPGIPVTVSPDGGQVFYYYDQMDDIDFHEQLDQQPGDGAVVPEWERSVNVLDLASGSVHKTAVEAELFCPDFGAFIPDTSEVLLIDKNRIVAVRVSPPASTRTVFELRLPADEDDALKTD